MPGWIIGENLETFIHVLAWQVDTILPADEWETVRLGLEPTDQARGQWAEYAMPGIHLRYAWTDRINEGTYIDVEVSASDKVESVAEALIAVMQAYRLCEDR